MRSGPFPLRESRLVVRLPAGEARTVRCASGEVLADTEEAAGRQLLIALRPDDEAG